MHTAGSGGCEDHRERNFARGREGAVKGGNKGGRGQKRGRAHRASRGRGGAADKGLRALVRTIKRWRKRVNKRKDVRLQDDWKGEQRRDERHHGRQGVHLRDSGPQGQRKTHTRSAGKENARRPRHGGKGRPRNCLGKRKQHWSTAEGARVQAVHDPDSW
ncbi:hypothetical protein TRVL_03799 [Trypanosoma vivax]|nr:hypothetical protein TRVL_03799 [Trypanosoma vivax]